MQPCLSIWLLFCSIKFSHCWRFEIMGYWIKMASTMALSILCHASFSQIMAKAIFPFVSSPFVFLKMWGSLPLPFCGAQEEKREVLYGAFCLYMIGFSKVAKNCSISANSYRSLEKPVWDWLTFWNSFVLACTAMPVNNTVSLSTQMLWQIAASCVATAWHNDWCYKAVAGGLDFFGSFCTKSLFFCSGFGA